MDTPFHAGERSLQARVGMMERMQEVGRRAVRDHMPDQHREFYGQLPFVLLGTVAADGRSWASVLSGPPGFMQSPEPTRLVLDAPFIEGDPAREALVAGAPVGLLGIELHTRRRNRMNGRVEQVDGQGIHLNVEQTVGNCPKYIQGRTHEWVRDPGVPWPRAAEALERLDADAMRQIGRADTLFVATQAPADQEGRSNSADVSHRGGRSGFVRIEDDRTLLVPDFSGNLMFMTLGNLALDPHAGVLFIDFDTGDLLSLSGRTELVWDDPVLATFEGAERAWRFHLEAGWRWRDALPWRARFRDWSPHALQTGTWR